MPIKIEAPITDVTVYKNMLVRDAILEYTDRIKNHLLNNDRNYLAADVAWLQIRIHEIDNADFEEALPNDEDYRPF